MGIALCDPSPSLAVLRGEGLKHYTPLKKLGPVSPLGIGTARPSPPRTPPHLTYLSTALVFPQLTRGRETADASWRL